MKKTTLDCNLPPLFEEQPMKILLIGANGTIGSAVARELEQRHEVVRIGRTSGDFQVDISDSQSIRALFEKTGRFDCLLYTSPSPRD